MSQSRLWRRRLSSRSRKDDGAERRRVRRTRDQVWPLVSSAGIEIMNAPKVLARYLDVEVNGFNEVFSLPDWRVASCREASVRNITKQKLSVLESRTRPCMPTAPPNILVVDDDRETRSLIAKYLRGNGCNVTGAIDGREMVRAMADHRVDLLILDVMLPGEDGLSLCRKVRAESQVPIIMLTARGEDVDRILGLEMGADDYLAKPFNPRELLARINAVLRRHAAAQTASAMAACCRATACSTSRKAATPARSSARSMCWSAASAARSSPIRRMPP